MTIRMAERILQGSIIRNGCFWTATCPEGVFDVRAVDEKDAAQKLVDLHWREVCKIVFRRAGYRCEDCAAIKPLSVHHIVFRSHGRRDTPSNLTALCCGCHERRHGAHVRAS